MGALKTSRTLTLGEAKGDVLGFDTPISFWGGVDPNTGTVCDPRHPQFGEALRGRVLVIEETVGSSSSSAIMLELMRQGTAPAGIILGTADAILVLGVVVGLELGYPGLPVVEVGPEVRNLPRTGRMCMENGLISWT